MRIQVIHIRLHVIHIRLHVINIRLHVTLIMLHVIHIGLNFINNRISALLAFIIYYQQLSAKQLDFNLAIFHPCSGKIAKIVVIYYNASTTDTYFRYFVGSNGQTFKKI
jgi:hypothetical protein